ncbi:hypothetical protein HBI38_026650 [Parastagonospora nodorum]|nr:hypothetical protein HBI10_184030 [Parastagonospora nodorum]KAH4014098.1 hypothetical protein HBI13_176130 [Parastagonospora nodorum]KAH4612574.1 hypothetical protein HBH82_026250 [Parastagonospora nodorum]KAH4673481.1 hypothetical protein HBH78_171330 [Parastagonospora nodorum]KAH4700081.1 hypothetical protein HBH67_148720 [Parastagonospora nodorum]
MTTGMTYKTHCFRFMHLPVELRLMVYESLSVHVTHHRFEQEASTPNKPVYHMIDTTQYSSCRLVWKTLEGASLLATCRQINKEASAIIQQKLNEIKSEPIRIIVTPSALQSHLLAREIIPHISHTIPYSTDRDLRKLLRVMKWSRIDSEQMGLAAMNESECHFHIAISWNAQELAMTTTERLSHIKDIVALFYLHHYMHSDLDHTPQRPTRILIQLALIPPEDKGMHNLLYAYQMAEAGFYEWVLNCATKVRLGHAIDEEAWKDSRAQG